MLANFVELLTQWVEQVVLVLGAPGIVLIALFENLFPPTPSELLYPLTGKLVYDGAITPLMVISAGVLGSLIGSGIYYYAGYRLGEDRAREFIIRWGTIRLAKRQLTVISAADFDRSLVLFQKHGAIIVLVARVMPLVHGVVSIPAGVVRMNLILFFTLTAIGAALWIAPLTLLGMWLGSQWDNILYGIDVYENIWYLVMALAVAFIVFRRLRPRHQAALQDASLDDETLH